MKNKHFPVRNVLWKYFLFFWPLQMFLLVVLFWEWPVPVVLWYQPNGPLWILRS